MTTDARTSAVSSLSSRSAAEGVDAGERTDGENTPREPHQDLVARDGGVFVIAAALVFVNGYVGYMVVLLAVAASAAVNLR